MVGDSSGTVVHCEHRTETSAAAGGAASRPLFDGYGVDRMGNSFVRNLGTYRRIVRDLEEMMEAFRRGGTRKTQAHERLAHLFIQYAHTHCFDETPELTRAQRDNLFRICFLILEKEQSQWQSACFFWGNWKLGMTVSFARLILLFKWGRITLRDIFCTFAVYSNVIMRNCFEKVQATCEEIDKLYEEFQRESDA
ncbi:uncharacterized protein LOC127752111 isoform X2 [Frankliniella occidentalis]|uniref:Uncharacterized protein LOC127752111 isoform X2 n=1 Tax=Frankliniella occidentalis TaxID=133901 RepID=A0A9C6XBC6_FRAOC|nr:uncharacterized protein LOC127752111 isoform X2 [Frankliniella occidentalis]